MNNKPNYLKFESLDATPPPFPKVTPADAPEDAWKALKKTIHEAAVSYENDCYLATTILCGKIIETLLKRAYYAEFEEDPDRRRPRLNTLEIRKRLRKSGFLLESAVDDQLALINRSRNTAAHGSTFIPNEEEAGALSLFTKNVIKIIIYTFCDKAIKKDPGDGKGYYKRGLVKSSFGEYTEAVEDFNKAVELKSHLASNYFNRGKAQFNLGKYTQALEDFDRAINRKQGATLQGADFAEAYYNRGRANYELGNYKKALENFDKAIELNDDFAEVYHNRGRAKDRLGKSEEAVADFSKAIELDPKDTAAYWMQGSAKAAQGEYKAAILDFDEAIRLEPGNAAVYRMRGSAKAAQGEYEAAILDFDEVIRLEPDDATAYQGRRQSQEALGNHEAAEGNFANAEYHDDLSSHTKDIQTERKAEGEESEFWAPIRRGEFGELFAGQPVLVGNDGWISKRIHGVEIILSFRKNRSYVSFLCTGENRIERRDKISALFPEADYDYSYRESTKRARVEFPILNKGKDHPENWDEIRQKLVTMGTDIYDKIKESDL